MSDLPFHHFLPGRSESSRDLIINIAYPPEMHKAAGRIRALIAEQIPVRLSLFAQNDAASL